MFSDHEPEGEAGDDAERLDSVSAAPRRYRARAALSEALDGLEARAAVLLTGPPSAGKSTELARLALALGWPVAWLDAEMGRERVAELFRREGATARQMARVHRAGPPKTCDWRSALDAAGGGALRAGTGKQMVVVDSLHAWAKGEAGRQELLDAAIAFATKPGALVCVVQHWARDGHGSGSLASDHKVAAAVTVLPDSLAVTKCWWAPLRTMPRKPREPERPEGGRAVRAKAPRKVGPRHAERVPPAHAPREGAPLDPHRKLKR